MSYQVLARKWRPRTFRELVGQQHVLQALVNALDHDRLHHAYLFTGTRGVGKTTIARILAKCLNCETGVSSEPCGQCSACKEIDEGRFIDLLEVDAASRTKVEDTRELLENVQYAPTRGRFKVYLIDEVHMLSSHSFNALLKTLEEPPPHVKFLLATTDPQKLPVTILSRCLQFHLKNMDPERIVDHLKYVLEQEMVPFEDAALWQLGRAADGSMRDAMSLADQAIAFGGGKVSDADVRSMLGTIDQNLVYEVLTALVSGDGQQILQAVEQLSQHAPDYSAALAELLSCLHRIAIAQALPEAVDNSRGDRQQVLQLAQQLASEDVQLFYQTALLGRRDLPMSPDPRAGFEMVLLRMLAFRPQGVHSVPQQALTAGVQQGVPVANSVSEEPPAKKSEPSPLPMSESSMPDTAAPVIQQEQELHPQPQIANESLRDSAQLTVESLMESLDQPVVKPDLGPLAVDPVDPALASGKRGAGLSVSEMESMGLRPARNIQAKPQASIAETVHSDLGVAAELESESEEDVPLEPCKLDLAELKPELWVDLYLQLGIGGVLQSTVSNCQLTGVDGNKLSFVLDHNNSTLFDSSHQQRLADSLSDYFDRPVEAVITLGDVDRETPAICAARLKQERHQAASDSLYNDPILQQLLQQFDAVLDDESIKPVV